MLRAFQVGLGVMAPVVGVETTAANVVTDARGGFAEVQRGNGRLFQSRRLYVYNVGIFEIF